MLVSCSARSSRFAQRGVIPHDPVHRDPGRRTVRSVPDRRASGGQVMGSTASAVRGDPGVQGVAGEDHEVAEPVVGPHGGTTGPVRVVQLDPGPTVGVPRGGR